MTLTMNACEADQESFPPFLAQDTLERWGNTGEPSVVSLHDQIVYTSQGVYVGGALGVIFGICAHDESTPALYTVELYPDEPEKLNFAEYLPPLEPYATVTARAVFVSLPDPEWD